MEVVEVMTRLLKRYSACAGCGRPFKLDTLYHWRGSYYHFECREVVRLNDKEWGPDGPPKIPNPGKGEEV